MTREPDTALQSRLSTRVVGGYALGSVGTGGFGTLPGLVLSYYLTDTLGVAAGAAGLVVTVPKIWDVVIDPFVGYLADRSAARRGSRRIFLLLGALMLPLAFTLIFAVPPAVSGWVAALWVVLAFMLATTAFSLFQVPYIALPAELTAGMSDSYTARTRLLAPRIAVLALAILAFGAGGPMIRDAVAGPRLSYFVMALVAGSVMGLGMLAAAWGTTSRVNSRRAPAGHLEQAAGGEVAGTGGRQAVLAGLAALRTSAPLRALLATFVLQALATGAMLAAAQYVATYTLGDESAVTLLFAALVAPALLVMPLARRLANRVNKKPALIIATLLFALASASLVLMIAVPGPWVYGSVALAGIAYAGMQLYPLAMLPDIISADAHAHGNRAGVISGLWTAGETAGLALGPTLALAVLAVTGFRSRTGGDVLEQPPSAMLGVVLIFSALPALLALVSLLPLGRYRLPAESAAL